MLIFVSTNGQRSPSSLMSVLAVVIWPMVLGCSSDAGKDEQTVAAPKSVEEIKTIEEAAAFLQLALREAQRDSRALRELPIARAAQQRAVDLLHVAIQWLEGKAAIEPTEASTEENDIQEKSLLGIWRHRLNADGTENLMIMGPENTFVAVRGSQVWVGKWERRDEFLYTQNTRDSADQFTYLGLPDIQRIANEDDESLDLKSITHEDHPGFTLTRIR